MLKRADFEREPCTCPMCHQAGVSDRPQLRSPQTGAMLHGYELLRLHQARDTFWRTFRAAMAQHSMPATAGTYGTIEQRIDAIFAPRDEREPGSDG